MKKLFALFILSAILFGPSFAFANLKCCADFPTATDDIPLLEDLSSQWQKIPNVAMYKEADWSNVVYKAKGISVYEAMRIANSDPRITFFFYVKGWRMVLENLKASPTIWRVFNLGDAVFFSGEPSWGTAPDLADGYIKQNTNQ